MVQSIHGTIAGCRQLIDNRPGDLDAAAQKLLASFATMAVRQLEHASALRCTPGLWLGHVFCPQNLRICQLHTSGVCLHVVLLLCHEL